MALLVPQSPEPAGFPELPVFSRAPRSVKHRQMPFAVRGHVAVSATIHLFQSTYALIRFSNWVSRR